MTQRSYSNALTGPGMMFLSAAIFGFFGFMMVFPEIASTTGKLIPMVVTLKWTLRAAAVAFLLSAVLSMANPRAGEILYAGVSLISAGLFAVVAVWDLMTPQYVSGVHWFLLLVFAAWNGFGSYSSLREILNARRIASRIEPPTPRYNRPL
ncbi:MAG: hypothetical protein V3T84_03375 [Phycisphaerales bacterium]